jgi:hypothetical protein
MEEALAPTPQVLELINVDDGKMSSIIVGLEREIQEQVDAKMRLASDSHVYEQLSEDIKSKSAILAALKAGLRPARNMVRCVARWRLPRRQHVCEHHRGRSRAALIRDTCPHPCACCRLHFQGDRPHTSPERQRLAFAKKEATLNLFRTMRQLAGS